MKDRILKLLVDGIKPSEIASIVGCTPSYVSQLVNDPIFKEAIEKERLELQTTKTEEEHVDIRYNNLEHKLITATENALDGASLGELTRAIEVLNKRADSKHARKNPAPTTPTTSITVVSLALPMHALGHDRKPTITLNDKQEIIAIGGQALAPMSSDAVKGLFAARTAQVIEDQRVVAEI